MNLEVQLDRIDGGPIRRLIIAASVQGMVEGNLTRLETTFPGIGRRYRNIASSMRSITRVVKSGEVNAYLLWTPQRDKPTGLGTITEGAVEIKYPNGDSDILEGHNVAYWLSDETRPDANELHLQAARAIVAMAADKPVWAVLAINGHEPSAGLYEELNQLPDGYRYRAIDDSQAIVPKGQAQLYLNAPLQTDIRT